MLHGQRRTDTVLLLFQLLFQPGFYIADLRPGSSLEALFRLLVRFHSSSKALRRVL